MAQRQASKPHPLIIEEQGSFAVGGQSSPLPVLSTRSGRARSTPPAPIPRGRRLHGDHAYVFYQVPVDARKLPLVF